MNESNTPKPDSSNSEKGTDSSMGEYKCTYNFSCCDKGENGECLSADDCICDKKVLVTPAPSPPADSGRLLTEKEIDELYKLLAFTPTPYWQLKYILAAQRDLTASLKEGEIKQWIDLYNETSIKVRNLEQEIAKLQASHKAEVERIFQKFLNKYRFMSDESKALLEEFVEALKASVEGRT